jgi:hypothetical protein
LSVNPQVRMEPAARAAGGWYHKFKILLFIVFAFEIGFFLMLFPWLQGWDRTSVPVMIPWLAHVWDNTFFRGAISGLGAVNVYISLLEVGRLRRGG